MINLSCPLIVVAIDGQFLINNLFVAIHTPN
jgi:hypothetical protein